MKIRERAAPIAARLGGALLATALGLGGAYGALAANLTYNADTTITLTSPSTYSLTIVSGSTASALVVNAGTVVASVGVGDVFTLTSSATDLIIAGENANVTALNDCSASQVATITITSTTGTGSYTLTPVGTKCNAPPAAATTSGGSSGSSGGASGAAATTTTTTTTVTPPPPAAPSPLSFVGDASALANALGVGRNEAAETSSRSSVAASASEFGVTLSASDTTAAANFIAYGVSDATVKLGSGERLALVRDQLQTLGRVSVTALEQLATGQKPTERNLPNEVAQLPQVLRVYERLVGHRPNFKDADEDLAWNTMMYRVRFTRDLVKERAGIGKFRNVFGRTPTSPLDWATVRAWGYALQP